MRSITDLRSEPPGQAIGILMECYSMNQDRAFDFLVRASSTSNHKLRDIAQELVDQHN